MAEKPIIFTTEMVKAIRDGRKTQARRIVKLQPPRALQYPHGFIGSCTDPREVGKFCWTVGEICDGRTHSARPLCQPGDRLWVRETWGCYQEFWGDAGYYLYKADYPDGAKKYPFDDEISCDLPKWRSPLFMPRAAARIWLEVVGVRVERVQDITEDDARAEGFITFRDKIGDGKFDDVHEFDLTARDAFAWVWDDLYAKKGFGWDANLWVWVFEFKVLEVG